MQTSESVKEIYAAIAMAQAQLQSLKRSKEVKVKTKNGGTYSYAYTPLDEIIDHLRKPLANSGLSYMQMPTDNEKGVALTIRVMHSSGEWIEDTITFPIHSTDMKEYGGLLTYARRYQLTSVFGIASDDDTDGGGDIIERGDAGEQTQSSPVVQFTVNDVIEMQDLKNLRFNAEDKGSEGKALLAQLELLRMVDQSTPMSKIDIVLSGATNSFKHTLAETYKRAGYEKFTDVTGLFFGRMANTIGELLVIWDALCFKLNGGDINTRIEIYKATVAAEKEMTSASGN